MYSYGDGNVATDVFENPTPLSYDWGNAPSFNVGGGGGGSSNIYKDILGGITGIERIAGSVKDISAMSQGYASPTLQYLEQYYNQAAQKLDDRSSKTLQQIQDTFERIAGLTGVSTSDAVQDYYNRFSDYMDTAYKQAREDLATQPDLTKQYKDLSSRISDIRSSDLNLLNSPQYMQIAKSPQSYMSSVDTAAIKDVMDLGPQYRDRYSYADPQTQSLMRGRPDAVAEYAKFFASSPDIKGMMDYQV
jgi:hypothetical protein